MMLSPPSKRAIWWAIGTVVTVCLVLVWIVRLVTLGNQSSAEISRHKDSSEPAALQAEEFQHVAQLEMDEELSLNAKASVFDLQLACQGSLETLSEKCILALDTHLLQKPLTEALLHWIEFPNAPTYASIFSDPVGDLKRVFAVLERAECRLDEGMRVRVDLVETCDAGAIARFAKFLEVCRVGGEPTTLDHFFYLYQYQFLDLGRNNLRDNLEIKDFGEPERKFVAQSGLESRWRFEKCKVQYDSSLALHPLRDSQQVGRLIEMSRRFGQRPTHALSDDYTWNWTLISGLKSLANRLGAEETFSSTYAPFSPSKSIDTEWDQHVQTTRPWLGPWRKFVEFPARRERVLHGIDLVLGLQDVGAKFDWNHLVEVMCSEIDEDTSTCQEVLGEIKQSTHWTKKRRLQALDEFETRALELGLYD